MKVMVSEDGKFKYNITEHIITTNWWEYYVTDIDTGDDLTKYCYVMGFENEFGMVYMPEIEQYIMMRTKDLEEEEVLPAHGFKWEE